MIPCCFAVVPDRSHQPLALFADLQDAMEFGLDRLGEDAFSIKYMSIAHIESDESSTNSVRKVRELMSS